MICEIISAGKDTRDNSYYDFVMKFAPMLSSEGLCVLLDVTVKTSHNHTYLPVLNNRQVNQALRELKGYKTLLPLSCSQYEKLCLIENCFTQQKFYVSHKRKTNDISKVSYRVIAQAALVNVLITDKETEKYVLQKSGQSINKTCLHLCGGKIIDEYI
jgi:Cys-tRNA synthase (O-phospho-L-seryl-tRNA:Cys-tRNA synthase)